MYDIVLLTSNHGHPVPQRTTGAYRIASILREHGYSVKVVDFFVDLYMRNPEDFKHLLSQYIGENTEFVGISSTFLQLTGYTKNQHLFDPYNKRKNELLEEYKIVSEESFHDILSYIKSKHGVPIVLGGYSISTKRIWLKFQHLIDNWIDGFADTAVIKFLETLNPPKYYRYDQMAQQYDFRNIVPTFHVDDNIMSHETLPLEISRGCRFACKFCSHPLIGKAPKDNKYLRSADSIYAELKYNYDNFGTTHYQLMCDTFNESDIKMDEMEEAIERLGVDLHLMGYNRLDLMWNNEELTDRMYRLGVRATQFGIESLYDRAAKAIGKGLGKARTKEAMQMVKSKYPDWLCMASLIAGLPYETEETFREWGAELVNGDYLLDSISVTGLSMPEVVVDGATEWLSEFGMNPTKYGYQPTGLTNALQSEEVGYIGLAPDKWHEWKSDNWTSERARELAWELNNEFMIQRGKLGPWLASSLHGYSEFDDYFSWDNLSTRKKLDYDEARVAMWTDEVIETYWEKLTNE